MEAGAALAELLSQGLVTGSAQLEPQAVGAPVRLLLSAGTHELDGIVLDGTLAPSELTIEAAPAAATADGNDGGSVPVLVLDGVVLDAPQVTLRGLQLVGGVVVTGGNLRVGNCTYSDGAAASGRRELSELRESGSALLPEGLRARAIAVTGGVVELSDVRFQGLIAGGAVGMSAGQLRMRGCALHGNAAARGAGVYVRGGRAVIEASYFAYNEASESGGALCVDAGDVSLGNQTLLEHNVAPRGTGASIFSSVYLRYALPTPLARWVLISDGGGEASLAPGAIDDEFPYPCSPGLLGDSYDALVQSGPLCSGACPAGYSCGKATIFPVACPNGTFCRSGSPAPSDCPEGTAGLRPRLEEEADCTECAAGTSCPMGSAAAVECALGTYGPTAALGACLSCPAGRFANTTGRTECDICTQGAHCPTGSASPVPCVAGTWSGVHGLLAASECDVCPLGSYCPTGASLPTPCPAGRVGRQERLAALEFCSPCPDLSTSLAGSSACTGCVDGYYAELAGEGGGAEQVVCWPCLEPEQGAVCAANSILATVELRPGYWRMSNRSTELSKCVKVGSGDGSTVTACVGGKEAEVRGRGYCVAAHSGPLCQVCEEPDSHFDADTGLCQACLDPVEKMATPAAAALVLALLAGACILIYRTPPRPLVGVVYWVRRLISKLQALELKPRFKFLISFYQIVIAIPEVYNLQRLPTWYQSSMTIFTWVDLDWSGYLFPGSCIPGGFRSRLLLRGLAPLALLLVLLLGFGVVECGHAWRLRQCLSLKAAGYRALPVLLFVSFCMCPTVSAGIFATWGCDVYEVDSAARLTHSMLREDLSVACSEGGVRTEEHQSLIELAYVFVAIWPLGLPLCYFILLQGCQRDFSRRAQTPLVAATELLHKEYKPTFYWWELLSLLQRLILTGFVLLIDEEKGLVRMNAGVMVALLYLVILLLVRPYKRPDNNFIAIATQFSVVCVLFSATLLRMYYDISELVSPSAAQEFTGFASAEIIVWAMLVFNFSTVTIMFFLTSYQVSTEGSLPTIRRTDTKAEPDLTLGSAFASHLFLSHIWSSGQDQMAVVKRQLQMLLPGVKVFLDVDDLTDMGALEASIKASQSVLIFLSRGYFFSFNVQRELAAMAENERPLILLHEADPNRGGAPIEQLVQECEEQRREYVFEGREVILWQRTRDFQLVSLKMIVRLLLTHAKEEALLESSIIGRSSRSSLSTGDSRRSSLSAGDSRRSSLSAGDSRNSQTSPASSSRSSLSAGDSRRSSLSAGDSRRSSLSAGDSRRSQTSPASGISSSASARRSTRSSVLQSVRSSLVRSSTSSLELSFGARSRRRRQQKADKLAATEVLGYDVYIPGEISRQKLVFMSTPTLYISAHNPGTRAAAEELRGQFPAVAVAPYEALHEAGGQLSLRRSQSYRSVASSLMRRGNTCRQQMQPQEIQRVQRLRKLRQFGAGRHVFLLYLNKDTWEGPTGRELAAVCREVLQAGMELLLLHERDTQRGSCEFARFLAVTPEDLKKDGVYHKIAVPLHPGPHRRISYALAARDMGAVDSEKLSRAFIWSRRWAALELLKVSSSVRRLEGCVRWLRDGSSGKDLSSQLPRSDSIGALVDPSGGGGGSGGSLSFQGSSKALPRGPELWEKTQEADVEEVTREVKLVAAHGDLGMEVGSVDHVVRSVAADSIAAQQGIRPGDRLLRLNGKPIGRDAALSDLGMGKLRPGSEVVLQLEATAAAIEAAQTRSKSFSPSARSQAVMPAMLRARGANTTPAGADSVQLRFPASDEESPAPAAASSLVMAPPAAPMTAEALAAEAAAARAEGPASVAILRAKRVAAVEWAVQAVQALDLEMSDGPVMNEISKNPRDSAARWLMGAEQGEEAAKASPSAAPSKHSALARARTLGEAYKFLGVMRTATSAEINSAFSAALEEAKAAGDEAFEASARQAYGVIAYRRKGIGAGALTSSTLGDSGGGGPIRTSTASLGSAGSASEPGSEGSAIEQAKNAQGSTGKQRAEPRQTLQSAAPPPSAPSASSPSHGTAAVPAAVAASAATPPYSVSLTKTPLGLGMDLSADNMIRAVKAGSQAARARIAAGDKVVTVNGRPLVEGTPLSKLLRGVAVGAEVKLGLLPAAAATAAAAHAAAAAAATAATTAAAATPPSRSSAAEGASPPPSDRSAEEQDSAIADEAADVETRFDSIGPGVAVHHGGSHGAAAASAAPAPAPASAAPVAPVAPVAGDADAEVEAAEPAEAAPPAVVRRRSSVQDRIAALERSSAGES